MSGDATQLSEADEGTPVLDDEGNQIGVVARVDEADVYVDPDPDVSADARSTMGWGESLPSEQHVPAAALVPVDSGDDGDGDPVETGAFELDLDELGRRA